jgi:UDP-glucose 4-epimerase
MRALLTGATGFIGSNLATELCKQGWEVVCLTRQPVESKDPRISVIIGDLLQPESLHSHSFEFSKIDVLFHVGALLPGKKSGFCANDLFIVNAVSTYQLLKMALQSGIRSFVYASSLPVIGKPKQLPISEDHPVRPLNMYLLSKLAGEMACEMMRDTENLCVSSLRITSPYGKGMKVYTVLPKFVHRALQSKDIEIYGTGQRTQNFIHVSDVVQAFLRAAETNSPGVYNVAGYESCSMQQLAELVIQQVPESKTRIIQSGQPDPQESYRWDVDLSRSKKNLNFTPRISLLNGISDYIDWVKSEEPITHWWKPI